MQVLEQKTSPFGESSTYELVNARFAPDLDLRTYISPLNRNSRSVERFRVGDEIWLAYTDDVYMKFSNSNSYEILFEDIRYMSTVIIDGSKSYVIFKLTSESVSDILQYYIDQKVKMNSKNSAGYTVMTNAKGSSLIMRERTPKVYQGYWVEDTVSENYLRKYGLIP
jgi:hypothetical protein